MVVHFLCWPLAEYLSNLDQHVFGPSVEEGPKNVCLNLAMSNCYPYWKI